MGTNGPSNSSAVNVVAQMLKELEQAVADQVTTTDIVVEFIDRRNRGEPVDKDELLRQVPEALRAELAKELDHNEKMLSLGKASLEARCDGGQTEVI